MVTSAIPVTEVREPPDVAQPHCVAHTRQDKLNLVPPVSSPRILVLLHLFPWNRSILDHKHRKTWD